MLDLNVVSIEVATETHNGVARVHFEIYIGEKAQNQIDEIVGSNKNIASAMLLPHKQQLVIEMATPSRTEDDVKKKLTGLFRALNTWHASWDKWDALAFTTHPAETKYQLVDGIYVTQEA